ncbi:MAG: glutathione S-transferase family protein, partial [Pseudomonadota bacterium]
GDGLSGNCYKIKLLMHFLDQAYEWEHVDILAGATHELAFQRMNPNSRVPVVILPNGEYLWESNAVLNYLAEGSAFLPDDRYHRAQVLQWQFFEQYSHEPYIATARYINKYLGLPAEREAEYHAKQDGGHRALAVMDEHLATRAFFVGDGATIADISLYAYTHVAAEGGFELGSYSNICDWLQRIEQLPGYVAMSR